MTVSQDRLQARSENRDPFPADVLTVYAIAPDGYLTADRTSFQLLQSARAVFPLDRVERIVLVAGCRVSRLAERTISRRHVPVLYLSPAGEFLARLETEACLQQKRLHQQLHRSRDTNFYRETAGAIARAGCHNGRMLLQRINDSLRLPSLGEAIARLDLERDNPEIDIAALQETVDRAETLYRYTLALLLDAMLEQPGVSVRLLAVGDRALVRFCRRAIAPQK